MQSTYFTVHFKEFVKKAVNNYEARPFKVAKGIKMMVVDSITGKKADFGSKKTIIESFKEEKIENISNVDIDDLRSKAETHAENLRNRKAH